MSVRVRFAPSPTGFQHIGGIRTALINYLFAKSQGGSFILRIEDTDRARSKKKYEHDLYESLEWLGIEADEYNNIGEFAPYIQSQRCEIYKKYVDELISRGYAYYCFTSNQKIESETLSNEKEFIDKAYDRSSRNLSEEEIQIYKDQKIQPVVRLKLPLEGAISIEDQLLGKITREVKDIIVDPILLKSDGYPTYHLANVVDDHLMQISHVMRSQEWIPTTPVHVYLYQCFAWEVPIYCHLPMVMGEDGQKLSKRNGSISVAEVKELGILPEALINCIALLGWSYDDSREFFTKQELLDLYQDGKINRSPSKFSMKKLRWFNAHYIRELEEEKLLELLMPYIIGKQWISDDKMGRELLRSLIPIVQERLELLSDITIQAASIFIDMSNIDYATVYQELLSKNEPEVLIDGLTFAINKVLELWNNTASDMEQKIKADITEENEARKKIGKKALKVGQVFMPLRMAVTASKSSPPIIPLIKIIGLDKMQIRVNNALVYLNTLI